MPLFNPFYTNVNVSTITDLVGVGSQANIIRDQEGLVKLVTPPDTADLALISNTGDAAVYIGFSPLTSGDSFLVRLVPEGYYESPLGTADDLHIWFTNGDSKIVYRLFKQV
jgi:hypothetical protein